MKLSKIAVGAVAALAMVLTGCSGGGGGSSTGGGDSTTLRLGALLPPTSLAASRADFGNTSVYYQAVYDTLLRESTDLTIEPWLATEWSYNDDNTVLTMKLRTDVKFTDGTPFDAEVAAQNLERFRDGSAASAIALASLEDAKALDASTLELDLKAPDPALLSSLTQPAGIMGSPKAFDTPDEQTKPVGSGPYVLDPTQTVVGSKYAFKKNDDYWAPEDRHYDSVVVTVYQASPAVANAVAAKQVDAVPANVDITKRVEESGYDLAPAPEDGGFAGLLLFDRDGALAPELKNVDVRRALNYAFDREKLIDVLSQGYGTATTQVFSMSGDAFDPALDKKYPYDPQKAKDLLAQAGYPNGFTLNLPQIAGIPVNNYEVAKKYLEAVGVKVKYTQVATNDAISSLIGGKFPASIFILGFAPTDWGNLNNHVSDTATFNVFKVKDAEVTALMKEMQFGDKAEAKDAARKINERVVDQAWFVPWFRGGPPGFATAKNVSVTLQPDNAYPYLWNFKPKG